MRLDSLICHQRKTSLQPATSVFGKEDATTRHLTTGLAALTEKQLASLVAFKRGHDSNDSQSAPLLTVYSLLQCKYLTMSPLVNGLVTVIGVGLGCPSRKVSVPALVSLTFFFGGIIDCVYSEITIEIITPFSRKSTLLVLWLQDS